LKTVNLKRAASIIFALVALLPLLATLPVLQHSGALATTEGQMSLLGALLLAVLGFAVLRQVIGQVARLAGALAEPEPAAGAPVAATIATPIPGLGQVTEIGQIGGAFARMLDDLRISTERLQDLVFKLSALNELVELAARIPQMQDLFNLVLERTMNTVRATSGSIMLADPERRVLRVVAARGELAALIPGTEVPVGQGVAGRVAETGEAVVGDESLCLPVRVESRIIGVVSVTKRAAGGGEARAFNPTDLQFLNTLLAHIAYALDNARLLQEARLSAERLGHAVEELKAAQTRVVEGETLRAMGQMASGMAHHLNNLLSIVSGRNQLLLRKVEEPEVRRSLEIVQLATHDAADVVRRVLGFTAMRPVSKMARVDLNEVVTEVVELTRPRWQDQAHVQGIAIEVVCRPGGIPRVAGEDSSLREVVMNLLLNAVEALPRGGTITITTGVSDGWVTCSVADDGVGMSDEVRPRALEPFFTTKGPHSTGLGLSVAHGVIQRHRGTLELRSAMGEGTVVTLRLPPAEPASADDQAPVATAPPPSLKILLIDDDARVRVALADALVALGHTVLQAPGGRDGLQQLEGGERVDVVITDLGMPGMNGWEVARGVKARWPDLPVGLVTGWAMGNESTPEEVGRVDFVIAKPYTLEGLHATLAPFRPR
jgi:signal transduction histidine kinase/CheY-like chemotaxis protein